jgi:hypothetical protein
VAIPLRDAPPMVRHAAGFHHDVRRRRLCKESGELRALQALARGDAPLGIRDRELEHGVPGQNSVTGVRLPSATVCGWSARAQRRANGF